MRFLAAILCLLVGSCSVMSPIFAQELPAGAYVYLPTLVSNQKAIWPDAPLPSFLGGQVEQESCITLKHSKCWNPRAELKTSRENGIGFGQFTRAYKADGTILFDKISELAAAHASLRGWTWERRYDPDFQLRAIVEMDKDLYRRQVGAASDEDRLSFALSAYNGGQGGILQDRRLCANTPGCDQSRWAGHVENYSMKQRVAQKGYGKSFFEINREYVHLILHVRRLKYQSYFPK